MKSSLTNLMSYLSPIERKQNAINKCAIEQAEFDKRQMRANKMLYESWTLHMDRLIDEWLDTESKELYVKAAQPYDIKHNIDLNFINIEYHQDTMFIQWVDSYFSNHEYYVVRYCDRSCLNFTMMFNPKYNI